MKSKASIKGHPLHPILVSFPIAFFTGAFLLDILAFFTAEKSFLQAAIYAETGGLIFAVMAAVPGIIDYVYTVPPKSSAKKRGAKHALINSLAVIVFLTALLLRLKGEINLIVLLLLDHCTHRGGSLADGAMICETVQCPWHGSQFNTKTGKVLAGPAKENIRVYTLTKEGETTLLML
ncbi:MAG TPA: DUF2231 domain-containing protein [Flavobacteriales bacterium]|nr:DUF2231 domain-containing protein [Flavobacteriales bacterium]